MPLARASGLGVSDPIALGHLLSRAGSSPAPGYRLWRGKVGEARGYVLRRG